jgi:predicted transposase/invertase (TIGR01784 family)
LPKFTKNKVEQLESTVERWVFFFRYAENTTDENLKDIAEKAPTIKLAYDELDKFNWNEKDLAAYEERVLNVQKEEAIWVQRLDDASAKGRLEGRQEEKIEVAKNSLKAGVFIDVIAQITGLSHSEILQLGEKT